MCDGSRGSNFSIESLKSTYSKVVHEKPARHLIDQRGRRSLTLYRKLNKCKRKIITV